jgi:hypothetical protein
MAIIQNRSKGLSNKSGGETNFLKTIPIDVTVSESHQWGQKVTDKPVEGGARVSDNIILEPPMVDISGILVTDEAFTMQEKLEMLEELRTNREPFTVVTSLKTYDTMFFDSAIRIERNSSSARAIVFTATLKHINFIESETTEVPAESVAKVDGSDGKKLPVAKKTIKSGVITVKPTGKPAPDLKGARQRPPKTDVGKKSPASRTKEMQAKDKSWLASMTF